MRKTGSGLTRRKFALAGAFAGAVTVMGCRGGKGEGWDFLSGKYARILSVLCDQIIPADDFPSASQAGVVTYIDRQLARHYRSHQDAYRNGLEQVQEICRERFARSLTEVSPAHQLEIANALEKTNRSFFELLREHTMEGYYGSPRHGGNRNAVSWRMLGLAEPPIRGRAQYDLRKGGHL